MIDFNTAQNFPMLAILPEQKRQHILSLLTSRELRAGEFAFNADDPDADPYFLVSGRLLAVYYTIDGKEIVYSSISPGGLLGELSSIDGQARSLSVYAAESATLAVLPRADFLDLIDTEKAFRDKLLQELVARIRFLTRHVRDLTAHSVQERLCAFILRFAIERKALHVGASFDDFPTHAEIANHIGANREAISRAISALVRGGTLEAGRRSMKILNVEQLMPQDDDEFA